MEARYRGGRVLFFPRFLFRGRGPGSFLFRGGNALPVCFVFLFLLSAKGVRPFLFSLRVSNLSLFSSKGSVCFLFRGGKGADFPEGCVEGFRVFFCSKGSEFFLFYREGKISELEGWPFPEPRFFPHPLEGLPKTKGSNCLVPADLLLINDFSENERIPAFLFFFFPRTDPTFLFFQRRDPTFFLFHRRDGGFPLNLLRGERRKET